MRKASGAEVIKLRALHADLCAALVGCRVLSVRQPWANALVYGIKPVENRTWRPKAAPGWTLIHASKRQDVVPIGDLAVPYARALLNMPHGPFGAIIGAVRFHDFGPHASDWYVGPEGWLVDAAVAFAKTVEARGKLGLWTPGDDLRAGIVDAAQGGTRISIRGDVRPGGA